MNCEWDFRSGHQLREFLFPNVTKSSKKKAKKEKPNIIDYNYNSVISMHTTGLESDYNGINSSPTTITESIFQQPSARKQYDDLGATECEDLTDFGNVRTFGSEEISDQDICCKLEMEKFANNLICLRDNKELLDVSQFSIEPSSSPSDDDDIGKSRKTNKITNIFTISVNENSCNAVEYEMSAVDTTKEKQLIKDLSFNGKLGIEFNNEQSRCEIGIVKNNSQSTQQRCDEANNRVGEMECKSQSSLNLLRLERSRENINEQSPDLFSDDEDTALIGKELSFDKIHPRSAIGNNSFTSTANDEKEYVDSDVWQNKEKAISKRIQNLLSGVLPPPSVTNIQQDIANMLNLYKANLEIMNDENKTNDSVSATATVLEETTIDSIASFMPKEVAEMKWPNLLQSNTHGLHYNRTKYTDNIEIMYMKLADRFIGCGQETGSSFTCNVTMSAKKKTNRKIIASPGNRLSHLARRRAIFSAANLQSHAQMANSSKLGRKPCIIDTTKLIKKDKSGTPKRRLHATRRTPGRKTPGSLKKSAKIIPLIAPMSSTATRESSKRALFLSPAQEEYKTKIAPEVSVRVEKSKRALFSPAHRFERSISNVAYASNSNLNADIMKLNQYNSSHCLNRTTSDVSINLKRRREHDNENVEPHNNKLAKCQSSALPARISSMDYHSNTLAKASSENSMYNIQQLSASHKQKLLWAVSTALKKKSIATSHENFNSYASVLAKVVKRLFLESLVSKLESTSQTMLRLADKLVFFVVQGKTVDDIYLSEKTKIESSKIASKKLSGYIAPDEYALHKERLNKSNLNKSVSRDSLNSSQSNRSVENQLGESLTEQKPLTNSSSKNNIGSGALRENHDSKSAQKNSVNNISFSGRNQKNLSPYNDKVHRPKQNKLLIGGSLQSSIMKVKRQISFDT